MTSTLPHPSSAPVDRTLRMLSISVNLLPSEVIDARRARKLQRIVLIAFVGVIVLIAAWFFGASLVTAMARRDLRSAEQDAADLVGQQRQFARLSTIQAESTSIDAQLKALFREDLQWSTLLHSLQKAPPAGVQITGISGNLQSGAQGAGGPAVLPNPTGVRLIGTLTVQGSATTKAAIADYIDSLDAVKGVANPLLSGVNTQDGVAHFTVSVDLTETAIGGRFTAPAAKKGKN
jgi:Tfp pilus assembly protein PilN